MAQRRKQSAAIPHQGSEQNLSKATQFLDLGDDMFSKIYAFVQDSDDRRALRQCCTSLYRSPAVNAHIDDVLFPTDLDKNPQAEDAIRFLAAFPIHATLKSVLLVEGDLKAICQRGLATTPMGAAARGRCRNVDTVILEDLKVPDGGVAALLSLLFPKIREPSGEAVLYLKKCTLSVEFLSILSSQSNLKGLHLVDCDFAGGIDGLMPLLGSFSSLSSLSVHLLGTGLELDSIHFCELKGLHALSLKSIRLANFDVVLQKLPALRKLRLWDICFPVGVHLASGSVRILDLTVSPTFPEVSLTSFPALQFVDFRDLDLGAGLSADDAQKFKQVEHMATWMAKCPTKEDDIESGDEDGDDLPSEEGFSPDYYWVVKGRPEWSGAFCDSMLHALSPLKDEFLEVLRFKFVHWIFSRLESMKNLCSFTGNAEAVIFEFCAFEDAARKKGLLEAVKLMPSLGFLQAEVNHPPRDTLAVLFLAHQEGRSFDLVLRTGIASCRARLRETMEEWQIAIEGLSSRSQCQDARVKLYVGRLIAS